MQSNSGPSSIPSVGPPGSNAKTHVKRAIIGQKKPAESAVSSPPQASTKQKVSLSDQSIQQLNDITAVSGVNLWEEEEQLFSGPKEASRVSEASRRVVQEEEVRLIFQKAPLQKKLAKNQLSLVKKWGLKSINNGVERCLSLSVEERLGALISNLVRLWKQRTRHRTIITSDVRQQIIAMNSKAREEWDKKQGDSEKSQCVNEANKDDDDKMRTTVANVAAQAAVGGDDMLSNTQIRVLC